MSAYKSFAVTKPGGSHVRNGIPCQDDSFCGDYKDSVVSIAVVADGHGDENCLRSDKGANFAVQCAKLGIQNFVKDHDALFKSSFMKKPNSLSRRELEKSLHEKLITYTVRSWNKCVWEHYEKNPFTPEELVKASEKYRARYEKGEYISTAYGTSLIAAAITPYYWFAFHIGDGRLTVLSLDGKSEQPVPWDPKCYLNVTTSICDEDILTREFGVRRFLSLNKENPPPIAVFLCTDGVDDNYPVEENEKHLFKLYRTIALTFAKESFDSTCEQLEELADAFATKGKGDDTSIAGFVDVMALKKVVPVWQRQIAEEETEKQSTEKPVEESRKKEPQVINAVGTAAYKKQMDSIKGGILKKITVALCLVLVGCVVGFGLAWFRMRAPDSIVTNVTINLEAGTVERGRILDFSVRVEGGDGNPEPPQDVTWEVSGNECEETTIFGGRLFVSPDESARELTVWATSKFNDSVSSLPATITVLPILDIIYIENERGNHDES